MLERRSFQWTAAATLSAALPLLPTLPPTIAGLFLCLLLLGYHIGQRPQPLPGWLQLGLTVSVALLVLHEFGIGFTTLRFGRDAGGALLACMIALKLLETRRLRDARGLVAFGLFAIMAAFLQDQGPLTLVLALLGAWLALAAMARLAMTEAPSEPEQPLSIEAVGQLNAVARLATLSLPLAIVGFFLFPRLGSPLWGLPQNSLAARSGLSEDMSPGDMAELFLDNTPIMRVRFDGPLPPPEARYWRGPVLTLFDGRRWTRGFISHGEAAELEALGPPLHYELEQEPTERHYLYALDIPQTAVENARLNRERALMTRAPLSNLTRQRLSSVVHYRLEPHLPQAVRANLLALPSGYNPRAIALARQWRTTDARPRAVIQQALQLFNREFTYTLSPGQPLGTHTVDEFLFETKRGYCEYFSSAFVVLMRAAGIPARVVTGYQGGELNPLGDYLIVRQSDAHAWAEVWLEGQGWVRIDPTAAVAPERIERGREALAPRSTLWDSYGRPLWNAADWLRRGWNDFVLGYNATRQQLLFRPLGIDRADWRMLGIGLVIATGVALAFTLLLMLRRPPDPRPPLVRDFERFLARLARAGLARPMWQPPLAFAEIAAQQRPDAAEAILGLTRRYVDWRYAGANLDALELRRLGQELRRFRMPRRPPP